MTIKYEIYFISFGDWAALLAIRIWGIIIWFFIFVIFIFEYELHPCYAIKGQLEIQGKQFHNESKSLSSRNFGVGFVAFTGIAGATVAPYMGLYVVS